VADGDQLQPGETKRNYKAWALGVAGLLLVIFVAQNAQKVDVDFLWIHTTTPLIFALVIAGVLGALIGWLGPRVRRDRD
jgi:uncharacterized integral membrane protein